MLAEVRGVGLEPLSMLIGVGKHRFFTASIGPNSVFLSGNTGYFVGLVVNSSNFFILAEGVIPLWDFGRQYPRDACRLRLF